MKNELKETYQEFEHGLSSVLASSGFEENLNRLRTICRDNPKFFEDFTTDLIFSNIKEDINLLLTYSVISNFCEEFSTLVKLDLLQEVQRKLYIPQFVNEDYAFIGSKSGKISSYTVYQICLLSLDFDHGLECLFYFLEECPRLKRWFFGSIFNRNTVSKVYLSFKEKDKRPARRSQRKRGYDDKGSARDQTSILPRDSELERKLARQMNDFDDFIRDTLIQQKIECLVGLGYYSEASKLESQRMTKEKTWRIIRKT